MKNFKLKCIKTNNKGCIQGVRAYEGKIYDFVDGRTIWENGCKSCRYDSAEDFFRQNIILESDFVEVKELKELTFREVIANIKEGEAWENKDGFVIYKHMFSFLLGQKGKEAIIILEEDKFKLQRKEYTFEEAFKAYEEGKEIESLCYRYKKQNGKDGFYGYGGKWRECEGDLSIDFSEIRKKWYIND